MGSITPGTGTSTIPPNIPIIDFSAWSPTSTPQERLAVAQKLANACHTSGFVFITNHSVPPALLDEAFSWSKKLFNLKTEDKMKAPHPSGHVVHRGYSWPGLEKVSQVISQDLAVGEKLRGVVDCKESFELGSELNEEQPNVWFPEEVLPGFRKFMVNFEATCSNTSLEVLSALGLGMGLADPDFMIKHHNGTNNQLRLLHYPPIPAAQLESEQSARMPAHTDWGSITMLFQDDCGGLEVENPYKEGEFIKVPSIKNAIVMNIGDLLMRWSNDYLRSTLHRVTLPPAEDRYTGSERMTRARYSIPYFVSPNLDALIKCMDECANETNPAKYEPVIQKEYRLMRARLQYPDQQQNPVAAVAG